MNLNKPAKISLPEGWVWKTSRKYPGKIYYFNITTLESTWEIPNFDNSKSDNQKHTSINKSNIPNLTVKGNKRRSDSSLPKDKSIKESPKKKLCRSVLPEVIDLSKDEVIDVQTFLHFSSLHSKNQTPTAVVKHSVKKKKRNKRKATLLIEDSKSSAHKSILSPPLDKDFNDLKKVQHKQTECKNTKSMDINKEKDKLPKHCSELAKPLSLNSNARNFDREKPLYSDSDVIIFDFDPVKPLPLNSDVIEDIEMLDVSENLTKIDDLPSNKSASYYIVVDTNIFMHEVDFIDEIKDTPLNSYGPPHIFIPWVVIQELENLRKRNLQPSNIFRLAHKGMKYINQILKAKHPRFHGQSPKEMKEWSQAYSQNNDDRVLECCISLVEKMPREKVILLTNDVNLMNKAMICDIGAYDIKSFTNFLKQISAPLPIKKNEDDQKKVIESTKEDSTTKESCNKDRQNDKYDEIMTKARQMLKEVLISVLNIEMEEAYGAVWKAFKLELSHLKGILSAVMKYWRMVFSFHFSCEDKKKFEFLLQVAKRPQGFLCDQKECLTILQAIERIFIRVNKKWPSIKSNIENIKKLQSNVQNDSTQECQSLISQECPKSLNNEIECKPSDAEAVLSVFEHNWVVLNHLTGMFSDFCQIPHTFSYDKPAVFPPASQFKNLMCNLLPAVQMLNIYMSKIVNRNSNCDLQDIKVYENFCRSLKTFVPSLKIDIKPISVDSLSAIALKSYCDSPANQEKLLVGYEQLKTFSEKLFEVAAIISSDNKANLNSIISSDNTINSNEMICDC